MKRWITIILICCLCACANSQKPGKQLPHYDLSNPQVYKMPGQLKEISGITFLPDSNGLMLAEQDEEGKVFYFKLGDDKFSHTRFAARGDYEDIAVSSGYIFVLRSDGAIFSFPQSQLMSGVRDMRSWSDKLPKGEYEGMYANPADKMLYILCKHCAGDKTSRTGGGSIFTILTDGTPVFNRSFRIDVREIEKVTGSGKIDFHPSALAASPVTGEWFILSSVNRMVVVADKNWHVKDAYALDRSVCNQPEGIAFDSAGNLYISNEGGEGAGNILKFAFKK